MIPASLSQLPSFPAPADAPPTVGSPWIRPTWHGRQQSWAGVPWLGRHVVARGLCRWRSLSLEGLPAKDRAGRVRVEALTWQPFVRSAQALLLQGDRAQLFAWDADALDQRRDAQTARWPLRQVVPESLLVEPLAEGLRLLSLHEGFEAQYWQAMQLLACRWWPSPPSGAEWRDFVRGAGLPADTGMPAAQSPVLAWSQVRAWGGWVRQDSRRAEARNLLHLSAAGLVLFAGLGAVDIGRQAWHEHERGARLQAEQSILRQRLQPLADARRQALEIDAGLQDAAAWLDRADPLQLLAHLAQRLPDDGSRLREFDWRDGQLSLSLQTGPQTPRALYVQRLEEGGWFEQVRELSRDGERNSGGLTLVTRLRGSQPPPPPAPPQAPTPSGVRP